MIKFKQRKPVQMIVTSILAIALFLVLGVFEYETSDPYFAMEPTNEQVLLARIDTPDEETNKSGLDLLLTKPYAQPDFTLEDFDRLWTVWEDDLKEKASVLNEHDRRLMAFERYGFTPIPKEYQKPNDLPLPLQYTTDGQGNMSMNCFACHTGKVAGNVHYGVPNSLFALETLTEDLLRLHRKEGKELGDLEVGSLMIPLGTTVGTTNAVIFGIGLSHERDKDLNIQKSWIPPVLLHHDLDALPLWNLDKKEYLYMDAFAANDHRALMQFSFDHGNSGETIRGWENDFKEIYRWFKQLKSPKYPFPIDQELAKQGQKVFRANCADCHGTYEREREYPEIVVPIEEIGTDRRRFDSIKKYNRQKYSESWIAHYGKKKTILEPQGYVAPPLNGVWATAPYLHNGSVPTLWHVLNSKDRPGIWKRSVDGYDREKVGLEFQSYDHVPNSLANAKRRWYFDTKKAGKSNAGHTYPDELSEQEKRTVLEYLKTL